MLDEDFEPGDTGLLPTARAGNGNVIMSLPRTHSGIAKSCNASPGLRISVALAIP